MRIETLCTGDELLTGLIADTNSRTFQLLLLERTGLQVSRGTVVGDVRDDIIGALRECAARADVLLVSGGLGPTTDDLTAGCAAEALGVPLVESAAVWAHLQRRFAERGIRLTENNRRQALVPDGAEVIVNEVGAAPLFMAQLGRCFCAFVPGVPSEYQHLVKEHVVPRIERLAREAGRLSGVRVLKCLKTFGIPESHLDAAMQPLLAKHATVTFGYRTTAPENHLKLLGVCGTREEAQAAVEAAERDARGVLGRAIFGADAQTLPEVVLGLLRSRRQTLAAAESCTGGLLSSMLTDVPGASDVFAGGAVTYTEASKEALARVPAELLATHGAVSAQAARAMAEGLRCRLEASWALSITGLAGPSGGTPELPVGTVFIGLTGPGGSHVQRHRFSGDRGRIRIFAAMTALDWLRRTLEEQP